MGVEEENGIAKRPLTGINIEELDTVQRDMIGFNNKIEPYYMPRVATEEIDGKYILIIWVPAGINRPYNIKRACSGKSITKQVVCA